jgi:hypothetical protein
MDQSAIVTAPQEHDSFFPPSTMSATCLLSSFAEVAQRNSINSNDDQVQQNNRSSLSDPFPRKSSRRSFI